MIISPKKYIRRTVGERIYYITQGERAELIEINKDADKILTMINREMKSSDLRCLIGESEITPEELEEFLRSCCKSGILQRDQEASVMITSAEKPSGTSIDLEEYAAKNRIPVAGSIEITTRCNLKCKHCYLGSTHQSKGDISEEKWLMYIDEIIQSGCIWLSLTGGDPFLSHNFQSVYQKLQDEGAIVTVLSNGTTLTEDRLSMLQEMPPNKVEVSIYGYSEKVYESVTGVAGSYKKFRRGVEALLDRGIRVELKGILLSYNYHELDLMKGFAESLGVYFRGSGEIHESLNGSSSPVTCRLSPAEVARADFMLPDRHESIKEAVKNMHSPKSKRIYQCQAGQNGFHIDHSGVVHPCITERKIGFSLAEYSFSEIWRDHLPRSMSSLFTGEEKCYTCKKYSLCRVCPAKSRISTGEEVQLVSFLCRLADERIKFAT